MFSEKGKKPLPLFFGGAPLVFAMVARRVSVGMLLVIQMEAYVQSHLFHARVGMEARIAATPQLSHEAHLVVFLALKKHTPPVA